MSLGKWWGPENGHIFFDGFTIFGFCWETPAVACQASAYQFKCLRTENLPQQSWQLFQTLNFTLHFTTNQKECDHSACLQIQLYALH